MWPTRPQQRPLQIEAAEMSRKHLRGRLPSTEGALDLLIRRSLRSRDIRQFRQKRLQSWPSAGLRRACDCGYKFRRACVGHLHTVNCWDSCSLCGRIHSLLVLLRKHGQTTAVVGIKYAYRVQTHLYDILRLVTG